MHDELPISQFSETVDELLNQTRKLFENSSNFPAVHRNAYRVLASLEILRMNLEDPSHV